MKSLVNVGSEDSDFRTAATQTSVSLGLDVPIPCYSKDWRGARTRKAGESLGDGGGADPGLEARGG